MKTFNPKADANKPYPYNFASVPAIDANDVGAFGISKKAALDFLEEMARKYPAKPNDNAV